MVVVTSHISLFRRTKIEIGNPRWEKSALSDSWCAGARAGTSARRRPVDDPAEACNSSGPQEGRQRFGQPQQCPRLPAKRPVAQAALLTPRHHTPPSVPPSGCLMAYRAHETGRNLVCRLLLEKK